MDDFSMMWILVGYHASASGYYTQTIIERIDNDVAPFNITVYGNSSYCSFDNDYWTGVNSGHNANITLKKDCLYRASKSANWEEKSAGDTIYLATAYSNHLGACMIFR